MARINIYVEDELKARMDATREPPNWSVVACSAFEAELGKIAAKKGRKTMSDVIQRLKASKIQNDSESCAVAERAGRDWASHRASYRQLQRLSKHLTEYDSPYEHGLVLSVDGVVMAANGVKDRGDADVAAEWDSWTGVHDVDSDDEAALENFVRAAVAVFDEAEGSI